MPEERPPYALVFDPDTAMDDLEHAFTHVFEDLLAVENGKKLVMTVCVTKDIYDHRHEDIVQLVMRIALEHRYLLHGVEWEELQGQLTDGEEFLAYSPLLHLTAATDFAQPVERAVSYRSH